MGSPMGMRLALVMVPPQHVAELQRDGQRVQALLTDAAATAPDARLKMDKEWHGIHFLLRGDAWSNDGPYGQAVLGGTDIGPDLGYGPARLLNADEVAEIAAALAGVPIDGLRSRYNPVAMGEFVYPGVWEAEGDEALVWLLAGFRQLADFYARAAAGGNAVLLAVY